MYSGTGTGKSIQSRLSNQYGEPIASAGRGRSDPGNAASAPLVRPNTTTGFQLGYSALAWAVRERVFAALGREVKVIKES
jgi:hypothetical protein